MDGTNGTIEKGELFLEALSECGNITKACELAGLPRRTAYNWREEDDTFRKAWDAALTLGIAGLEDEAIRRAYDGVEKPLMSGGKILLDNEGNQMKVREYSDALLIFLLKGRKPEVYKERVETKADVNISKGIDPSQYTEDELRTLDELLSRQNKG